LNPEGGEAKLHNLRTQDAQRHLSREQFLTPRNLRQTVEIERLGGSIVIRSMSLETRERIKKECGFGSATWDDQRFTLMTIVESIAEPKLALDDLEALQKQDAEVIDEIVLAISMLNLTGKAEEVKKDYEPTETLDSL
jgi:hypothetical protein